MSEEKAQIIKLLSRSSDSLIREFALSLRKHEMDELIAVPSETVLIGFLGGRAEKSWHVFSKWLQKNRNDLYDKVCVEWGYCRRRKDAIFADKVSIVATLADLISSITIGVSPLLVAVIIVRLGLDEFCGCHGSFSCSGITVYGRPCTRLVARKGDYCWQHISQRRGP